MGPFLRGWRWFDRQGREITFMEWAELADSWDAINVGEDTVNDWRVSTKWLVDEAMRLDAYLGLDLGRFETMVFDPDGAGRRKIRYWTEAEAWAGHWMTVVLVREWFGPRMIEAAK